ncbi:MAG: TetR/AcrR family transcriptional regulator [Tabrizicola sp.]|jgi:AcrR family transcriptional regulator|nr:TetR/AcrR family transcriptional regulator [Tabrizicola sp.]
MQESPRRTQRERSDAMRTALIRAGRDLFVRLGFASTGTPDIVAAAGVTRGALYHHFVDKEALFAAVVRAEAEAVAAEIEAADYVGLEPVDALIRGGQAYLAAMAVPGRARLMLVEAPAILSPHVLMEIDLGTGGRTLETALQAAGTVDPRPMASLLSAAFDRAALAIERGERQEPWVGALERLVRGAVST